MRLLTLGQASLVDARGAVVVEQRKRIALLALLATAQDRGVSRDRLIATLNPESPSDGARHALHQLLYYLRQQMGDVFVGTDPLRLDLGLVSFDVADFERHLARGEFEEAAGLYQGPFLDGFHLPDSSPFEDWASAERARLAALYVEVLCRLADAAEHASDFPAAVHWWRTLSRADPLNARGALGTMRALAATGDRGAAIQVGKDFEALLRDELDVLPDPQLLGLMASLKAAPPAPPRAAHADGAFDAESASESQPPIPSEVPQVRGVATVAAPRTIATRRWFLVGTALVLIVAALRTARPNDPASRARDRTSIAIAPIANDAHDSIGFLAEGLERALVDQLAAVRGLRVIPPGVVRPHVLRLETDARAVGQAVDAATVLQARMVGGGDSLTLQLTLTRSADGRTVLAQRYSLDPTRLIVVERAMADSLLRVLDMPARAAARSRPSDAEAFALVMRARHYFQLRTPDGLRRARDLYLQAIDRDPAYADAYAGLASAYGAFGHYGLAPAPATFELAGAAARRALELDPENGEAISHLGSEQGLRFYRWVDAERELRRSVSLQPWRADSWLLLGTLLRTEGRFAEAREAYHKARDIEPLAKVYRYQEARAWMCEGQLDSALVTLRAITALGGTFPAAFDRTADILMMQGKPDDALAAWRASMEGSGDSVGMRQLEGLRGSNGVDAFRTWKLSRASPRTPSSSVSTTMSTRTSRTSGTRAPTLRRSPPFSAIR